MTDWDLAAIEQYREDAHYALPDNHHDEEDDGMEHVDTIEVEGEEDGWELVITTDTDQHRFNVHGIASTDELERQLRAALVAINDWKAGR